jgi:hypothetical protein
MRIVFVLLLLLLHCLYTLVLWLSQRPGPSRASPSRDFCSHCKKAGHHMDGCFQLHPEFLAEFRARRAALLNQQRCAPVRAQSQFIRPSTTVFTEPPVRSASLSTRLHSISLLLLKLGLGLWTLASFHVTSDSSHLVSCKPVQDGASVQTADGTPCSITHKGSLCTSKFSVPDISFFRSGP